RIARFVARGLDERNAIPLERRKALWRRGCGRRVGAGNLVGRPARVGFEDSGNDGRFAQGISMDCGTAKMRCYAVPGGAELEVSAVPKRRKPCLDFCSFCGLRVSSNWQLRLRISFFPQN